MYEVKDFLDIDALVKWINEHKPSVIISINVDSSNNWWLIYKK